MVEVEQSAEARATGTGRSFVVLKIVLLTCDSTDLLAGFDLRCGEPRSLTGIARAGRTCRSPFGAAMLAAVLAGESPAGESEQRRYAHRQASAMPGKQLPKVLDGA